MDPLLQDQLDLSARIASAEFFADVTVLEQHKGVTESDVENALAGLNEKAGKMGALVVVLMPTLEPESPDAPGPRYRIIATLQVIEQPLFNLGDTGTGKSAESIALKVRQLLHHVNFGRGSVWTFAGMEPVEQGEGKTCYGVKFARMSGDAPANCLPPPAVSATGTGPIIVTLSCADAAAEIWYSIDGSYPWAGNTAAFLYSAAVTISTECTLRAVAYRSGYQASNVASITISL